MVDAPLLLMAPLRPKTPKPIPVSKFHEAIEAKPGHEWNPSGITPQNPMTNNVVGTLIRYMMSFLLGVISAAFFLGGKTRDLNELLTWKGEMNQKIDTIDKQGTTFSRNGVSREQELIITNREQITDINKKIDQLGVMREKLDRMERYIDGEQNPSKK
jgi:hypothetical protein